MNMNMFNPEMMNQMKNMMDGKSMKNMLGNITNMSDDQLKSYLSMSGMGHISPQTFRQMAGQMKNMDENELERMKNMAPNGPRPGFPMNQPYNNSTYSTTRPVTNQNIKNDSNANKTNPSSSVNDYNYAQSSPKTIVDKLERIKIEGNNFFRQGKYKEACEKYYEILNEMDYISDSEKVTYEKQLEEMEILCRLNIANTKIKQEDYDLVIHECLKVLKKSENFKAHYRTGIAYYKKGSYQKAYHHLLKAKELNKDGDSEVEKYLKECKKFLDDLEEDKKKSQTVVENKSEVKKENEEGSSKSKSIINNYDEITQSNNENSNKTEEHFKDDEIKFKNSIKSNEVINTIEPKKTSSKIEKLKEIVDKEVKVESSSNYVNNKSQEDIEIEENNEQKRNNRFTQQTENPGFIPNMPNDMNKKMNEAQKHLENMDDSQFDGMVGMLRSMDNATIKSMMAMQGMTMSDEQIEMMKNVDPGMLKMAKKNFNPNMMPNTFQNNPLTINNQSLKNSNSASTNNINPPQTNPSLPNLNNMDFNGMLKMLQDNPQLMNMMGPQMANMFGGSGANQEAIMNSMQTILWLMSLPQRIKAFLSSKRGMLFISFIVFLIVAYFYNR